ncbi:alpha/beta fold hydrolase [Longispora sp. K20-0274]|uniref:alpha/beta fold hydrolase n=1 Tax=Longispora sp. K20-0274 TaxID=3088255 RepID=UPI00399A00C6
MPSQDGDAAGTRRQEIRFCRSADGTRIAYAVHGQGPPLVLDSCWLSHLQYDWESPVWRHFVAELGRICTVIRYDERGYGLSDWDLRHYSTEARVADLEAVVAAAGLDRFALFGMSQGGPVSVTYTVRHPERVTRLLLFGTYAAAVRTPEDKELVETFTSMIRVGWAREDPLFRRVFTNMYIPGATEEQMRWLDELQRVSTSTDNAVRLRAERHDIDVTDLLPFVAVPTLVLHAREERTVPFNEARIMASTIPGARLVPLETANHVLLADEPAWPVFLAEVTAFMAPDRAARPEAPRDPLPDLTGREHEILRLAAAGLSNAEVAEALTLSVRTVERHLSNVYLKLGVTGRAARTAVVAELVRRGLA